MEEPLLTESSRHVVQNPPFPKTRVEVNDFSTTVNNIYLTPVTSDIVLSVHIESAKPSKTENNADFVTNMFKLLIS